MKFLLSKRVLGTSAEIVLNIRAFKKRMLIFITFKANCFVANVYKGALSSIHIASIYIYTENIFDEKRI